MAQNNTQTKVYTLQQAISQSIANNGLIEAQTYEVQSQKALKATAWDFGSTAINYTYGQSNSALKDENWNIQQNFSFPTAYIRQNKLSKSKIKSSELQLTAMQNEIAGGVKATYYELAMRYSLLHILRQQDSLWRNFQHSATLRYEKGETTILEKLASETQLFETKNQLSSLLADIEISKRKLQTYLNESASITIADTVLPKLELKISKDSVSIGTNATLAFIQQQIEITKAQTKVEQSKLLPEFNLGYFNQTNKELSANKRFTGIQVGVNIPIVFFAQRGKIKSSALEKQVAETNYEYAQSALQNETQDLLAEYSKNKSSLDFYEKTGLQQAEMLINHGSKSYTGGNIAYIEYVQILKQAYELKLNYLQTINAYNQSIIKIEQIYGQY